MGIVIDLFNRPFYMTRIIILIILLSVLSTAFASDDVIIPSVTVTSNKIKKTLPYSQILNHEQIKATGATSLSQAIQELGGVQLQNTVGNNSQVLLSMRGFGANAISNTLMLVNGIPLTNPDMAPPDLNAIPLEQIEYIEIISGTESALYGDQAVGGVINIITRKDFIRKIDLSCSAGSYNERNCYASYRDHFDRLKIGISGLSNHTDNYRQHNNYDQNSLAGSVDYDYHMGALSFDYQVENERMLYPGALTSAQVSKNRRQASNATDFFTNWNGIYHLKQEQILQKDWHIETDLARREMHGSGVLFSPFTQLRVIHFVKPQVKGTWKSATITSGLDYENDHYHLAGMLGTNADELNKYGIFAQVEMPLSSEFKLVIAGRAAQQNSHLELPGSRQNTINRALASTIDLIYQPKPDVQIYIRRAGNFRFPKADENASVSPGLNALRTQRGESYEGGIEWHYNSSMSRFSVYQLNLRDEIIFDPTQTIQRPFGNNTNLSPTERQGFSLIEKWHIRDQVQVDGQYNYVDARFQNGINSGKRIPLVSDSILHIGLNTKFLNNWNLYAEAIFTGNQYPANDYANVSGKMGGYTVYNFNLMYHYKQLSASFRMNNIFNKYYYFYTVFSPIDDRMTFYPAPGRNFLLTIQYSFNDER